MTVKVTPRMWLMFAFIVFAIIIILPLNVNYNLLMISLFLTFPIYYYFINSKSTKIILSFFSIGAIIAITFLLVSQQGVVVVHVSPNSTIYDAGLKPKMIINEINNNPINNMNDLTQFFSSLNLEEPTRISFKTNSEEIVGLFDKSILDDFSAQNIPKTRLSTGLDLRGGISALVSAENHSLTISELDDLIEVTQQRLNVYGLSDVVVRPRSDSSGHNFMSIEIAGSSPVDLERLVSQQGKFEAKIGEQIVFRGGEKDITFVGKSGQDAFIRECFAVEGGEACNFNFVITLSSEAAKRQADITSGLSINITSGGKYLNETLDLYLDDVKIDSLNIGADLKGQAATQIMISGSGKGTIKQEAFDNAKENMKQLQTVLKTGSLPFKLKIEKIDRISPNLGEGILRTIFIAGLFAVLGVALVIYIKYRKIKTSLAMVSMMLSEILIIMGSAALINWNIDLAGIAGIIVSIGTGVDDQIVIVDESKRSKSETLKQRIKMALFIIFTAYATAVVSLLPLLNAGAGLLRGFAFTTLIGITAGVLITRPAFADLFRQMEE